MSYSFTSTSIAHSTSSPTNGSRTMTITTDPVKEESSEDTSGQGSSSGTARVLRLRGARNTEARVAWDDDVVDNEHMDKKKSKSVLLISVFLISRKQTKIIVCCIYHKPRRFDESSSDESSSSDKSDHQSSCGRQGHHHDHSRHRHHRPKARDRVPDGEREDESESNAYERSPQKKGHL